MNNFLVYWCTTGIESVIDITPYFNHEQTSLINALKGVPVTDNPLNHIFKTMRLRAMVNQHRHYELYMIKSDTMTVDDINDFADNDPGILIDMCRSAGVELFSYNDNR